MIRDVVSISRCPLYGIARFAHPVRQLVPHLRDDEVVAGAPKEQIRHKSVKVGRQDVGFSGPDHDEMRIRDLAGRRDSHSSTNVIKSKEPDSN